jgi:hypothetical protein
MCLSKRPVASQSILSATSANWFDLVTFLAAATTYEEDKRQQMLPMTRSSYEENR